MVYALGRVPLSLRNDIEDDLPDMEFGGIIAKIKEGEPIHNCLGQQFGVPQLAEW